MSDDTLPLFGEQPAAKPEPPVRPQTSEGGGGARSGAPLAERMRPRTLDEVVGQEHLAGAEGTLRRLLRAGHLPNLILHGPPGSGKTTLARVVAAEVDASFVPFSAVSEGVPRLREIVKEAEQRRRGGRGTLLFVDEIHRLNKGQQDFLLPYIESGLLTLIGATTEHPGFEINPAVLSRSRVLVLEPLRAEDVRAVLRRALEDAERGLGELEARLEPEAEEALVRSTGGDARQALTALEITARLAGPGATLTEEMVREGLQHRTDRYDPTLAYEMLSAFHKSLRSSSGEGALYWAMRMVRGGEDPKTLFRRMIAMAYEDVGLADPQAGVVAVQAMLAFERLGAPEGYLPLANAVLYLAQAPKSNRAYLALHAATEAAAGHPDAPVPLALRNATTGLMKEWGYGKDYRYAHDYEGAVVDLQCLPDALAGARFYEPSDRGFEREVAGRLREREEARGRAGGDPA
ncbi:MAG TPA: replication-associated recombination protein A [Longimicrobiaceae bacterium]|nr:replication-associated recombination protein A [Longimicrobiaceae bacterium]